MAELLDALLKPLVVNDRTRCYQEGLDREIDRLRGQWETNRGLTGARGVELPHEKDDRYWLRSKEERAERTSTEAAKVYARNKGRYGTAPLCLAAFCHYSPLSRHRGNAELRRFFQTGLRFHLDAMGTEAQPGMYDLESEGWGFGWDVESLIYGMAFCGDNLDPGLREGVRKRLSQVACRFAGAVSNFNNIGSYGNQRAVYALGLEVMGQYLGVPKALKRSREIWADVMPRVLDECGQVMEQHGPCMHYSYTAFFYAWLNLVVRGDRSQDERVARCLDWFRLRHTESMYPIAGPSTRQYNETMAHATTDLWPAAEQLAHVEPTLRDFVDRANYRRVHKTGPLPERGNEGALEAGTGHGGAPTMWAMLTAQEEKTSTTAPAWPRPVTEYYETMLLTRRSPLKYMLVRREYQTHFNVTDFMPFSGVQTWALGQEPPIIHPTPLYPSTTQAYGLDTARQGASHNWGLYGAGAMAADGIRVLPRNERELALILARYDWLWRFAFFTDRSTVVLEFGKGGPRRTLWTLNRVEPAEPQIASGVVSFTGRRGRLYSTVSVEPKLISPTVKDAWADGVRQLEYDCGESPAAFALSDESFRFEDSAPVDGVFRFSDGSGRYRVTLDPRFTQENPGCLRIDPWKMAYGTVAERIDEDQKAGN